MYVRRAILLSLSAIALSGCPAKVAAIEVAPQKLSFDTDTTTRPIIVTLKDADGVAIEDPKPTTFTSADKLVAMVDADGIVKPKGTGATTITVTTEELSATVAVDVVLLKRIQVQTPALVLVAGTSSDALRIDYMNERGEPLTVDLEKRPKWKPEWKIANPALATVDDKGVVTGVAAGSTSLTVSVGELKSDLTLTINPAPEPEPEPVPVPEPKKRKTR